LTQADLIKLATRDKVDIKKGLKKDEMLAQIIASIKPENLILSMEELQKICETLHLLNVGKIYSQNDFLFILEKSQVDSSRSVFLPVSFFNSELTTSFLQFEDCHKDSTIGVLSHSGFKDLWH
jgi:hypothetical protein